MSAANELMRQPRIIEMPYSFKCTHCGTETAKITTKEERKTGFVDDTRIMVDYIEDSEVFEGNWFEIIDDMKKGLRIACCTCEKANEGVEINDGDVIDYLFIDDEYPDGILLKSVVNINKKVSKKSWRVAKVSAPKPL